MLSSRFWPDRDQLLLLQFCLLPGEDEARAAWQAWGRQVDLDDLDASSFRIMSLVYRRLADLQIESPDFARIKGIYRYHWTRNQIAWRGKADLLRAVQAQGIEVLVLKGAALGPTVYPEPAARGMHDLDFLVRTTAAPRAIQLLRDRGWVEQHFDVMRTIDYFHGCSFVHPEYGEADLHWHVMRSHCRSDRDAALWTASRPFSHAGLQARMLCPEDQFLHACEHGQHHSTASALQWLADATLILRHDAAHFDWPRLVSQARQFHLTLCVRHTLLYLERHLQVAVPPEITRDLACSPVRWAERLELRLAHRPDLAEKHLVPRVALAACHHLKARPNLGLLEALRSFSLYYRLLTHERREWSVVGREWILTTGQRLLDDIAALGFCLSRLVWSGRWPRGGVITEFPTTALDGFHPVETELGSPFRWTQPEGALRLTVPPHHSAIRIGLRPLRHLHRLQEDGLEFAWDGQPIPADQFSRRGPFLILPLDKARLAKATPHTLSWKLRPWPAPGDPRALGLPISRVWTF